MFSGGIERDQLHKTGYGYVMSSTFIKIYVFKV